VGRGRDSRCQLDEYCRPLEGHDSSTENSTTHHNTREYSESSYTNNQQLDIGQFCPVHQWCIMPHTRHRQNDYDVKIYHDTDRRAGGQTDRHISDLLLSTVWPLFGDYNDTFVFQHFHRKHRNSTHTNTYIQCQCILPSSSSHESSVVCESPADRQVSDTDHSTREDQTLSMCDS